MIQDCLPVKRSKVQPTRPGDLIMQYILKMCDGYGGIFCFLIKYVV